MMLRQFFNRKLKFNSPIIGRWHAKLLVSHLFMLSAPPMDLVNNFAVNCFYQKSRASQGFTICVPPL